MKLNNARAKFNLNEYAHSSSPDIAELENKV